MPGYIIHMSCGKMLLKHIDENDKFKDMRPNEKQRKSFMAGVIMPDAAKLSNLNDSADLDRADHYPADDLSYFKTPDMAKFLKKHPISTYSWYYIGYALHLYLDILYADYLQGKVHFIAGTTDKGPIFKTNSETWTTDKFWQMMYEDYTNTNRTYIDKYSIKIDELPTVEEIRVPAQKISWYSNLYTLISDLIEHSVTKSTRFLDIHEIDALLEKCVETFAELYLIPINTPVVHDASEQTVFRSTNQTATSKCDWKAEEDKFNYFKKSWHVLVDKGVVSTVETCYMDIVIKEIKDFNSHASKHKNKTKISLVVLSILPLFAGTLTAAVGVFDGSCECIKSILIFASAIVSLSTTVLTQFWERTAHKETWIRYRMIYSRLINETENFCSRINEYNGLDDYASVKKYMSEINSIRNEDYKTFAENMGKI